VSEPGNRLVLEARDIYKQFPAPDGSIIEVLRGIDLSVKAGESISLQGQSGSGKSTFLNVISWLDQPSTGTVYWDGLSVATLTEGEIARRRGEVLGFVFQAYYLMPELNVLENVLMAARMVGRVRKPEIDRAIGLLSRVGLQDRMEQLPGKLSGGERQRVAIARALLNQPSILLADEPTGNLDEATADSVMELLLDLCAGEAASLILVTHNPQFANCTDRQLHLSGGQISG
jgi:lipoprotein-releasing system ATP-binding protein